MKWTENFHVSPHDTDLNGIARPSPVLRYMQETANLQLYHLGPSNEYLREQGMAFILARMGMRMFAPLHPYEKITVQSWACDSRLSSFYRCGSISRGDEPIAELMTVWALIDIQNKRIYRTSEITMNFETDEMLGSDLLPRIQIPQAPVNIYERTVGYSDVDLNRHMNNTNYPDMLCDYIGDMDGKRVTAISVNFKGEALLGEKFTIHMSNAGGKYYFKTIKENGACGIEAMIETKAV